MHKHKTRPKWQLIAAFRSLGPDMGQNVENGHTDRHLSRALARDHGEALLGQAASFGVATLGLFRDGAILRRSIVVVEQANETPIEANHARHRAQRRG